MRFLSNPELERMRIAEYVPLRSEVDKLLDEVIWKRARDKFIRLPYCPPIPKEHE